MDTRVRKLPLAPCTPIYHAPKQVTRRPQKAARVVHQGIKSRSVYSPHKHTHRRISLWRWEFRKCGRINRACYDNSRSKTRHRIYGNSFACVQCPKCIARLSARVHRFYGLFFGAIEDICGRTHTALWHAAAPHAHVARRCVFIFISAGARIHASRFLFRVRSACAFACDARADV